MRELALRTASRMSSFLDAQRATLRALDDAQQRRRLPVGRLHERINVAGRDLDPATERRCSSLCQPCASAAWRSSAPRAAEQRT